MSPLLEEELPAIANVDHLSWYSLFEQRYDWLVTGFDGRSELELRNRVVGCVKLNVVDLTRREIDECSGWSLAPFGSPEERAPPVEDEVKLVFVVSVGEV